MGRSNEFREPRRRGFDDDIARVHEERGGRSRHFSAPAPFQAEGPQTDVIVKWFNPGKGFGFASLSDGTGDAFLHVSVLKAAGHESVVPGARLRVYLGSGQKGPQINRILEIDESSAPAEPPRREGSRGRARRASDPSTAVQIRGTVKWFNPAKGFGFVDAGDGDKDIFVHISVLEKAGLSDLAEGQQVTVFAVQAEKGREAISIALAPFA